MRLESTQEQDISIEHEELDLHFLRCETIHTEDSYKFTDQGIRSVLRDADLRSDEPGKTVAIGTRSRLRASDSARGKAAIHGSAALEAVWPTTLERTVLGMGS